MGQTINRNTTIGTIWSAIDRFGIVIMQFIINLVLARLLTPNDFGLVGMIMIIVAVSNIIADGGFGAALIQKLSPNRDDFSTTFYVNVITAFFLYLIVYMVAPIVAAYLGTELLVDILRILSLVFVINSMGLVPKVKLRRQLAFKQIALSNIVAYIIAALTAILLAYKGFGVWSLIALHIINAILSNFFIITAAHWYPTLTFSTKSLKELFSFGEYMLISDILTNICFHIQSALIGKYFSPSTAGQYAQAKKMEEVVCTTLPIAMGQVLFPVFSQLQHDKGEITKKLSTSIKIMAFAIFPLLTILIMVAKPLIPFMFGDKWIDAVLYFQALCVGGFFYPMQSINYQAIAAVGKSRTLFYTGILRSLFLIVSILIGVRINMEATLIAIVLSNIFNYIVNAALVERYIGYKITQQIIDISRIFLISISSGLLVYSINYQFDIHWILLVVIYLVLYVIIAYLSKCEALTMVIDFLNKKLHTR